MCVYFSELHHLNEEADGEDEVEEEEIESFLEDEIKEALSALFTLPGIIRFSFID